MERLVDHYKGVLMENSRLNHAARMAAKQHVLLASPEIPPATKKIRLKALGPEVRRATKRVRVMSLPGAGGAAAGATPKGKPKVPPKPTFLTKTPKTPISVPLPDDDWEEELAAPIPSTSKSKTTPTLSKGKSPVAGPSKGQTPLTTKRPRFRFSQQAAKEGKKLAKEVLKLKRQPGWSEWGEKVQRKLHGKDY